MTEDEMVGWHHQLNRYESEQALGDDEGQGSLTCCSPLGCKNWDMTEQLNNKEFPGGPVVKALHAQCAGHRFDTWSGN